MSDDIAVGFIDDNPFDDREGDDREDDDEVKKDDGELANGESDDDVEIIDDDDSEDEVIDDNELSDDEAEIEIMQIQINESDLANRIPDTERQSYNLMTKFEKTIVISTRAEQIARGSPPTIQTDLTVPIAIAEEELNQNKIPIIIRRPITEGAERKYEEWNAKDLIKN